MNFLSCFYSILNSLFYLWVWKIFSLVIAFWDNNFVSFLVVFYGHPIGTYSDTMKTLSFFFLCTLLFFLVAFKFSLALLLSNLNKSCLFSSIYPSWVSARLSALWYTVFYWLWKFWAIISLNISLHHYLSLLFPRFQWHTH